MRQSQDIILGGNHSQMAALNMRALLADALLPMEESSKAILFVVNRNDIIIVQRKENISILSGFLYFVQDCFFDVEGRVASKKQVRIPLTRGASAGLQP